MKKPKFSRKAQSTAEYAIIIGVVVGALIVMQTYIKRGIQGRFKDATDGYVESLNNPDIWQDAQGADIGNANAVLQPQWEFDRYEARRTNVVDGTETTEQMLQGGQVRRDINEVTSQAQGDYQEYRYGPRGLPQHQ